MENTRDDDHTSVVITLAGDVPQRSDSGAAISVQQNGMCLHFRIDKTGSRCLARSVTLLLLPKVVVVGVPGLGVCFDDVVSCHVHRRARPHHAGGEVSVAITHPRDDPRLVECDPPFHLHNQTIRLSGSGSQL